MFKKKRFYILTVQYKDKYTSNTKTTTSYGTVDFKWSLNSKDLFLNIYKDMAQVNGFNLDESVVLNYYISE